MANKKILFITAYPPSEKGAAVKNTICMLREFSQNFSVDVVYFKNRADDYYIPDVSNVNVLHVVHNTKAYRLKNALLHLPLHPIFTVRYSRKVLKIIQKHIEETDYCAIIFDHSQTFMYAQKLKFDGYKIMLSHDIEAQRIGRSSGALMYKLCLFTEKKLLSTPNAKLFALCQKDVNLIKELYCYDASVSLIYVDKNAAASYPNEIRDEFVMFGGWKRPDNYEGALWLLNGLSDYLRKKITINIIGSYFPIEKVHSTEKIMINDLGFVDNPYPLISECRAMLCPLFSGAGIKVKVIDSLACGTPVIGTDIAFEGFPEKYSSFMYRSQDLKDFAHSIETIDVPMEERNSFKDTFVSDYKSTTIPKWLFEELSKNNN